MCAKKAVIVGCGVGGPVAALLLRRAGFEPEICEAQAGPDDYSGLFLNLASNGLRVLDELGLAAAVSAEGFACPRMVMWSGSGKRLGEVRNGAAPGQGAASVIIKRAALHRVLREAAERAGVPIRWGKQLTGYDALPDGRLRVAFADGGETIADLLVGADGLHSRARRLIDPAAPDPAYTGLVSCGGFAYCPGLEPTPGVQHFIFGRKAFFGYLVKPGGETYWFNNLAYPGAPRRAELEAIPDAEWRRRLLELHAGDQPFINEIITATEGPIGRYPIYDLPALRRWQAGPAVLLGDAAHATSPSAGQGAALALEDALALALCLRDAPAIPAALAAYERMRRGRAEKIVRFARRQGNGKAAANPVSRWLRDLIMPVVLKQLASSANLDWLYGYALDWDAPAPGLAAAGRA